MRDRINLTISALQEALLELGLGPAPDPWIKAKRSKMQLLELRATQLGECLLDFGRLHAGSAGQDHQADSSATTNILLRTAAELRMRVNLLPIQAAERMQKARQGAGPPWASWLHHSSTPSSQEPLPTSPSRHLFAATHGAGLGLAQNSPPSSGPALPVAWHQAPTGHVPPPTVREELPTGGQPPPPQGPGP